MIPQMFRKGRLPDNGQHNITKEKKEFQSLNEKFKKNYYHLFFTYHGTMIRTTI